MKRNSLLSMILIMLLGVVTGCSSDDELSMGESWYLYQASYGEGGVAEVEQGEVTLTFITSSKLLVTNKKAGRNHHFLPSGEYGYSIVEGVRNIWIYEQTEVKYRQLEITDQDNFPYSYKFNLWFLEDGSMCLDGGIAVDGPGYFFRKY